MRTLRDKVAIVGGASRGGGRGIALALGDAGATVYVAARTSRNGPKPADGAAGSVEQTAEEVCARGGTGIAVRADLADEAQIAALFQRVEKEQGRLDLLANSAWSPHVIDVWNTPFWKLDSALWADMQRTVASYWFTTVYAMRMMAPRRSGLVAFVTDNFPDDPSKDRGHVLHDLGHESLNRLIAGMAPAAKKHGVTIAGVNSGFMRTERVLMHMKTEALKRQFRFDLSESVEFLGRAVTALLGDTAVARHSGKLLWAADLADEYGFSDVDGRVPRFDYSPL